MDPNIFIDNLRRDKARGIIAPHQIVLLLALYSLFRQTGKIHFNIEEVNSSFQLVWKENKDKFKSTNNNVGLPLKSLNSQGIIKLEIVSSIFDFRNLKNLNDGINKVNLTEVLLKVFHENSFTDKLKERLSK